MSNQTKKNKPNQSSQKEENMQQEKLQAIILLDSYSNKYEPLSSNLPECLLPLIGGKTLLDNNIEFLIENKVEEIYLFCTKHHQLIKNHIEERKWRKFVEIHFMYNFKCQSLGDAMREIDAKGVVRTNFILLTATSIISNIKLKEYLETHKQVSKTDRNALMTIMCINNQTDLGLRNGSAMNDSSTLIIHNINKRLIHYEHVSINKKSNKYIKVPSSLLDKGYGSTKQSINLTQQAVDTANAKFRLQQQIQNQFNLNATTGYQNGSADTILHLKTIQNRTDLFETQIYLCNPHVLHMFTDNFDYDSFKDFVHGVLADEEVSGYTIYIDEFKRKYGSHCSIINNLNSYYFETMRLLQRTDLILDYNTRANYRRLLDSINVYLNKGVIKYGDNTKFERNVFIDYGCKIGENCELVNCYIGSNCLIGNNVKLSNTIIWPGTKIGNNTEINASLLGFNVKIGNNCKICENTLFGSNCRVKDGTNLTERAVYYTKDVTEKKEKKINTGSENETDEKIQEITKQFENVSLDVVEDNYHKYILSHKSSIQDDEEDEDDFGSIDGDYVRDYDEEDDNQSNISGNSDLKNISNDTSKNNHFFVSKIGSNKVKKSILLKQNQYGSDNDLSCYSSDEIYSSSDEDDFDRDNSDNEDDEIDEYDEGTGAEHHHEDDTVLFYTEVISVLKRALKENLDPTNVILEINSRKHANGIQIDEVCYFFVKSLLNLPIVLSGINTSKTLAEQQEKGQKIDYLTSLKSCLQSLIPVLENYYSKTRQSQRIFLNSLQDFFIETKLHSDQAETAFLDSNYVKTIHYIYNDCSFLSEEVILEWYEKQVKILDLSTKSTEEQKKANIDLQDQILIQKIGTKRHSINKLKPFIDWLNQDEEESDDDDDE